MYGRKTTTNGVGNTPSPKLPPKANTPDNGMICTDSKIDTIFNTHDGETFAFKGSYYYKLTENAVESGYPKLIADGWANLPSELIARKFSHNKMLCVVI